MKKYTALKQHIKNDTCVEFRRDIKALTLPAECVCVCVCVLIAALQYLEKVSLKASSFSKEVVSKFVCKSSSQACTAEQPFSTAALTYVPPTI